VASSVGARAGVIVAGTGGKGGGGPVVQPRPEAGPTPGQGGPMRGGPVPGPSQGAAAPTVGAASGVFVEENKAPVVLLADVSRNWIIAVAPSRVMALIDEWVAKLDVAASPGESQFDVLEIRHADMDDVARQIAQTIEALPTGDARQS